MIALDLKAHRCPTAMILARRTLRNVISGELVDNDGTIAIQTIEPSFVRDLPVFLNSEAPNISIESVLSGDISIESIQEWKALGRFDNEDWEGQTQYCFLLKVSLKE